MSKRPGFAVNRRGPIALPIPTAKLLWRALHTHDTGRIVTRSMRSSAHQRCDNHLRVGRRRSLSPLRAHLEAADHHRQPGVPAQPDHALLQRATHRRNHAPGGTALVCRPASDPGRGEPLAADPLADPASGGGLRLSVGGQQPVRGPPALPAAQPGAIPDRERDPPSGRCTGRAGARDTPAGGGPRTADAAPPGSHPLNRFPP